jgi:CheY-like chemotaxis protein
LKQASVFAPDLQFTITVLLVDDEPAVRMLISDILEEHG